MLEVATQNTINYLKSYWCKCYKNSLKITVNSKKIIPAEPHSEVAKSTDFDS